MELILLAHGLLEAFPEAGLLRVEICDGIAMPLRLTDKPQVLQEPAIIAQGRTLEKVDIEGWSLNKLLEEISRNSDGTWINRVDASTDINPDYNDPHYSHKTEFDIDLAATAALPFPELGPVTVTAGRAK